MPGLDHPTDKDLRSRGSLKWTAHPADVLPLWIAEMDFSPAAPVTAALEAAVRDGAFGYPPREDASGLPDATADWQRTAYGWDVDPGRVHTVPDVLRGLEVAIDAYTPDGSAVIVPVPAYGPFFEVVRELTRPLVEVPMAEVEGRATLDLHAIDQAFAQGARTLILCHPHNPLGTVYRRNELVELSSVVERHGARVVSDEIHGPMTYPGIQHVPYASVNDAAAAHTVTLVSATKAWNLAGLCCAQVILSNDADQETWRRLSPLRSHGASLLGVRASVAAYRDGAPWLREVMRHLDTARNLVSTLIAEKLAGVEYRVPEATYLGWLDCSALDLARHPAEFFLEHARVALTAGAAFGTGFDDFARINLATSHERLERAVSAMGAALQRAD